MQKKINIAQTIFAVLCVLSGIAFGGLGFLVPAPASQSAHALAAAHAGMPTPAG